MSLFLLSGLAHAQELRFDHPILNSLAEPSSYASYNLPIAPWADGNLPAERLEGMLSRRAWQLEIGPQESLLSVLAPLRAQLQAQGYEILLDCETRGCGGFDFRFATEVMAEPAMHVDLGDFRFLSARKGGDGASLLISRSAAGAFVQMISIGAKEPPAVAAPSSPERDRMEQFSVSPSADAPQPSQTQMALGLPIVLEDLVFQSGAVRLAEGDYPSLALLADWLSRDAENRVTLVGHSDASGALKANIDLSKRRAEAVREVLISRYGVRSAQVSAEGVGPLAPRDSNLTEEGRLKNRRVEALTTPRPS